MIIVADSGSTKTDWAIISSTGSRIVNTIGLNPFFLTVDEVAFEVNANDELKAIAAAVEEVYFYGAGCSAADLNKIIFKGLSVVFTNAKILVEHDLLGAALASCGRKPGISCILGTGSNSCYFDGKALREEIPSLGYILGDEGSGSNLGRRLLRAYFYKKLPTRLMEDMAQEYNMDKNELIKQVYNKGAANVYLASFAKFCSRNWHEPVIRNLISESFEEFFEIHVKCFSNYREVPIHFIGSIAYNFSDQLSISATEAGCLLGKVIQKPIDGLVAYHSESSL